MQASEETLISDLSCQRRVRIVIAAGDAVLITDPMNFLHQRNDCFKLLVSVADPVLELIMTGYQLLHRTLNVTISG